VRFALVGLSIGVTILVWLSVLRLVAPQAVVAYPLLLVLGIAGFVLGSFSPDPTRGLEDEDDEDEEEFERTTAQMDAASNDTSVTTPDPAVTIPGNQER
jgi:fatty acid desaturase